MRSKKSNGISLKQSYNNDSERTLSKHAWQRSHSHLTHRTAAAADVHSMQHSVQYCHSVLNIEEFNSKIYKICNT